MAAWHASGLMRLPLSLKKARECLVRGSTCWHTPSAVTPVYERLSCCSRVQMQSAARPGIHSRQTACHHGGGRGGPTLAAAGWAGQHAQQQLQGW